MRAAALLLAAPWARAQSPLPAALRILVAAPPGGLPDQIARLLGPGWAGRGPLAVDNRPGAAGLLAVNALLLGAGDGGTLLLGHAGLVTMNPFLYTRLAYDAATDLVPVAPVAETAFGVAVGPEVPSAVTRLAELQRWADTHPAKASFGSPGIGTLPHVLGEWLARRDRVRWQHVPYAGGPPALNDVVNGRIAAVVLPEGLLRPLHQAGRLRLLATSRPARHPALPGVPTLAEEGHASPPWLDWWGLFAPRATSEAQRDGWAAAVRQAAAASADTHGPQLEALGLRPLAGSPAEMARRLADERQQWRDLLPGLGIRLD